MGTLLHKEELGQLGVLSRRMDATTAFGRKAEFRHSARKAFVKEDCSRRVRAAVLRKSAPLYQQSTRQETLFATVSLETNGVVYPPGQRLVRS